MKRKSEAVAKVVYSIGEFCQAHGISRGTWYAMQERDRPKTIKVGKRVRITLEEAAAWRKRMEK